MHTPHLQRARRLIGAAALAAAIPATWAAVEGTPPPPRASADEAVARLEKTFWVCDYLATTQGPRSTPVVACRHATEELKRIKFDGSFTALLAWWRERKEEEHAKVAALASD